MNDSTEISDEKFNNICLWLGSDVANFNDYLEMRSKSSESSEPVESSVEGPDEEPEVIYEPTKTGSHEPACNGLTISKTPSELQTSFVEIADVIDVKALIQYIDEENKNETYLPDEYGFAELKRYQNIKTHLENYSKKIKDNKVVVKYIKPRHGYGRVFPEGALGLMSIKRDYRNALLRDNYYDFDLSNAQPEIVKNICKNNNINCPFVENYCNNRAKILDEISEKYNVSNKIAKKLMLRLCFFGTFEGWAKDNNIDLQPMEFINGFINELRAIAGEIRKYNPTLYEFARKKQERENKSNYLGCMFAFYLQEMELRIIEKIYVTIKNITDLMTVGNESNHCIYENDGLKLLKVNVNRYGGVDKVQKLMNSILIENNWGSLRFENKEIETKINLDLYRKNIEMIPEPDNSYETKKTTFEENVFMLITSGTYGCKINGELVFKTERKLIETYRHIKYLDPVKNRMVSFIVKWINDDQKRMYDGINVYPPPLRCPDNIYNLWEPFYVETIKDYEYNTEAVNAFTNHLRVLCNHDEEIYTYILKFIAHMFQYPAEKPGRMPVFVSNEGAGKGSLMQFLSRMIGGNRVVETADAKLLVGDFNGSVSNKFLVCFNELSKSKLEGNAGKLKEFITDPNIQVNRKGIDAFTERSFHRSIATTNVRNPVSCGQGDRRFNLIACSNEHCQDYEYFKNLHEVLKTDDALASVHEYFMNVPDVDKFKGLKPPMSTHQQEVQQLNTSPVVIWLERFINEDYYDSNKVEFTNKQLHDKFINWRDSNGFKHEVNSQALGAELLMSGIPGITRGKRSKHGIPKVFEIDKVREYFNKLNEKIDDAERA